MYYSHSTFHSMNYILKYQTVKTSVGHTWPPIAPDGLIGGREAMKPWDNPRVMKNRRIPSGAMHGPH